ncbi:hypothetical protein RhiLY_14127 [Ceratobasidium sp. AG-Ba]|nr:hypothetical protein RhiLY_14127 [Ceratobasidium sp. AG-Ba]
MDEEVAGWPFLVRVSSESGVMGPRHCRCNLRASDHKWSLASVHDYACSAADSLTTATTAATVPTTITPDSAPATSARW